MSETLRLKLPLIHSNQAQKEITHNEALQMLDGIINPVVEAVNIAHPPEDSKAGELMLVGVQAEGMFNGHENKLAQNLGGNGWQFITPTKWQKVRLEATGEEYVFDGKSWQAEGGCRVKQDNRPEVTVDLLNKDNGEYIKIISLSETLELSGSETSSNISIPHHSIVIAVNVKVLEAISGTASFNVGVAEDLTRYGSNLNSAEGTTNIGLTGMPLSYYYDTAIIISTTPNAATSNADSEDNKGITSGKVTINIQSIKMQGPWNWN